MNCLFYCTHTGEHHFCYDPARPNAIDLVTLRDEAPAIERLRYEPGVLWAWGCIPSDEQTYTAARQQALAALSAPPKTILQLTRD